MHYGLVALLLFELVLSTTDAIVFHRTFGFRSENKTANVSRIQRKEGIISRISRIGAVPRIPADPTATPKRIVPQKDADGFNLCKIQQPCANDGVCIPEGNGFYCECPRSFYGKKCEFVANERECSNNLCQNNSTCYSVDKERDSFSVLQRSGTPLRIRYQCWCKHGTYGDFCDYTEEMRICSEDVCNHHGIINVRTFNETTKCECKCEEYYSGSNCEIISPCRDFECINDGICELNATGHPYCRCPKTLHLSPGDHCENIELPDSIAANECRPCSTGFLGFVNCLKLNGIDESLISHWWKPCETYIPNCLTDHLSRFACFNKGRCVVAADRINSGSSETSLVVQRCECQSGFEGTFCERRIPNACESLLESEKCIHGKCAYVSSSSSTRCICDPGYYGLKCEFERPCTSHPCGDAMCIELPVSDEMSDYKFPVCVCNFDQAVNNNTLQCSNPNFKMCRDVEGIPKCKNNAYCYPCLSDNDKLAVMNACNDEEWNRGFRCICPPGLAPPFCHRKIGPCDSNRCMNNARCQPASNDTLEYSCICPKGYKGQFCEMSEGACSRLGHICKNGICVDDVHFRRGFRCECGKNFSGFNCDIKTNFTVFDWYNEKYMWSYPLTLFIFLSLILVISTAAKEYSSRNNEPQPDNLQADNP